MSRRPEATADTRTVTFLFPTHSYNAEATARGKNAKPRTGFEFDSVQAYRAYHPHCSSIQAFYCHNAGGGRGGDGYVMYTASRDALVNVFEVSGASAASAASTASSRVQGGASSVRPVQSLQGHVDWVNDVVGLGGGLVATCSSDTTCRVWREDGTSRCLSGHSDYVRGL